MNTLSPILSLLAVLVLIALFFWSIPIMHDKTLVEFSNPLLNIPAPEKSEKIDSIAKIGHQVGNSNHCDYLASILVKTDLAEADIESYYKREYKGDATVEFLWLDRTQELSVGNVNPTGIFTLDDWYNVKADETGANLIVYIFEPAMTSSFDLRCR